MALVQWDFGSAQTLVLITERITIEMTTRFPDVAYKATIKWILICPVASCPDQDIGSEGLVLCHVKSKMQFRHCQRRILPIKLKFDHSSTSLYKRFCMTVQMCIMCAYVQMVCLCIFINVPVARSHARSIICTEANNLSYVSEHLVCMDMCSLGG